MNARLLPPILATAMLIVSCAIWLPIQHEYGKLPAMPAPLLPTAAELPDLLDGPEGITVFDSNRRGLSKGPISITRETPANEGRAAQYRLRAYIGGNGLWVVTLEDGNGKYYTVKNGELIPHSHLEFRGMEFHTSSNGLPEGTAVFFDQSNSNYVDVVAYSGGDAPINSNSNESVQ